MIIYLLSEYNRYSDRMYKNETIDELSDSICYTATKINFVENDGISTELILNRNIMDTRTPDYLFAIPEAESENDESHWFIISSERLRTGQTRYTLRRDLIRDNIDFVRNSTLKINRGYVPVSSPFLFQPESIDVNEIVQRQDVLTDDTKYSWAVAYLAKKGTSVDDSSTWDEKVISFGSEVLTPTLTYDSLTAFNEANYGGKVFDDSIVVKHGFDDSNVSLELKSSESLNEVKVTHKTVDNFLFHLRTSDKTITKPSSEDISKLVRSYLSTSSTIDRDTYNNILNN